MKQALFTQNQSLKWSLLTWEVIRYLPNIRLHQGDSLICAVQIFSLPDWLKMRESGWGGLDQLGKRAVGEEIENTITHTCTRKHTLWAPSGEQVQSWSVADALHNSSAAVPPVHLGWVREYSLQHSINTHTHTRSSQDTLVAHRAI